MRQMIFGLSLARTFPTVGLADIFSEVESIFYTSEIGFFITEKTGGTFMCIGNQVCIFTWINLNCWSMKQKNLDPIVKP
jgi:hypothetical protein